MPVIKSKTRKKIEETEVEQEPLVRPDEDAPPEPVGPDKPDDKGDKEEPFSDDRPDKVNDKEGDDVVGFKYYKPNWVIQGIQG